MRVNIRSCLLAFVLGCNVTAGIFHEIVEEKTQVSLRCPHSVEGDVTWSRERNEDTVNILTFNSKTGRDIRHIDDPGRRYSSLADKTLFILKAVVSDSGRYFCNNESAADLTVIPSGTTIVPAPERTSITLTCPHDVGASRVPTWSRDSGGRRFNISSVDQTLTITDVQPGDSGLYYCDGKPAVYLNVTKAAPEVPQQLPSWVFGVVAFFLLLLLLLFLIIVYFTRRRFKRRVSEERSPVYDEIQDGVLLQPINGGGTLTTQAAAHCMADFSDGSNRQDPTYNTIPDLPPVKKKTVTSPPNESAYSLIGNNYNNEGLSQLADNTYCLLEKPKVTANNQNQ